MDNSQSKVHVEPIADFKTHNNGSHSVSDEEKNKFQSGDFTSERRSIHMSDGQQQIKVWRTYHKKNTSGDVAVIIKFGDFDYYDYLTGAILNLIKFNLNIIRIKLGKDITDFEKIDKKSGEKYTDDQQVLKEYIACDNESNRPDYKNKKLLLKIFSKVVGEIILPIRTKIAHHEAYIDDDQKSSDAVKASIKNLERDFEIASCGCSYLRDYMDPPRGDTFPHDYKDLESRLADYENGLLKKAKKLYDLCKIGYSDTYFKNIIEDDRVFYK